MVDLKRNRVSNWFYYRIKRREYGRHYKEYWEERGKTMIYREMNLELNQKDAEFTSSYIANLEPKPKIVLEYGCGWGRNLRPLEEKLVDGAQIYGLDISTASLEHAKKYIHGKAILQRVEGTEIPFGDKFFDVSFTSGVLQHIPPRDYEKICNELIRVTRNTIIHREQPVNYVHKYPHDYEKFYRDKGYGVKSFTKPDLHEYYSWYHVFLQP